MIKVLGFLSLIQCFAVAVVIFETTHNLAGMLEDTKDNDVKLDKSAPTIADKEKVDGSEWVGKPKKAPSYALTRELVKSIKKAMETKVPDLLVLHYQEVKDASAFTNALKAGLDSSVGKAIDLDLMRPGASPAHLQSEQAKYTNKDELKKRVKDREAVISDLGDVAQRLVVLAVGIEDTTFEVKGTNVKYKCVHLYFFQFVASLFCAKIDAGGANTVLTDLNFQAVGVTQYGRSGEEKKSGFLGKTFGFKGGFTIRMIGKEGPKMFHFMFTNVHLSATNMIHRRSELMELFRYAYAKKTTGSSWELQTSAITDLPTLPSVHFFAGDFNSRTLDNFVSNDAIKLSFPDGFKTFMKECWAGVTFEKNDYSQMKFGAGLQYKLKLCAEKKNSCEEKSVSCETLLRKIFKYEEYYEFLVDHPYVFQLIMKKTVMDTSTPDNANSFLFSPMAEQKVTFLPSYSHKVDAKAYKTDKQISFTDRLFYVSKAVFKGANGKPEYPEVVGLGYWSDKFQFLSDHAAVIGLFEVKYIEVAGNDMIPWAVVNTVPTIPSDKDLEGFGGKSKGGFGSSVISMTKSAAPFTTYDTIYKSFDTLTEADGLNIAWFKSTASQAAAELSKKTRPTYQTVDEAGEEIPFQDPSGKALEDFTKEELEQAKKKRLNI